MAGLQRAIFQQDNASPHTARVSRECLRHVATLPWPSRSPDLSPIEHLWDHMGRQIRPSTRVRDLEQQLQHLWTNLSQDSIQHLYDSLPDHITSCIQAKGGPTRY